MLKTKYFSIKVFGLQDVLLTAVFEFVKHDADYLYEPFFVSYPLFVVFGERIFGIRGEMVKFVGLIM